MKKLLEELFISLLVLFELARDLCLRFVDFCRDTWLIKAKKGYEPIVISIDEEIKDADQSTAIFTEEEIRSIVMRGPHNLT